MSMIMTCMLDSVCFYVDLLRFLRLQCGPFDSFLLPSFVSSAPMSLWPDLFTSLQGLPVSGYDSLINLSSSVCM